MFTGLVEGIGEVRRVVDRGGVREIQILSPFPPADLRKGASISIHGVCLTLIENGGRDGTFRVEATSETLRRSTLSRLRTGDRVHLERSLAVGGRFGGHIVQGHVDGTGTVLRSIRSGGGRVIDLLIPRGLSAYVVEKGSIAIDGVSLTVGQVAGDRLRLHVIPATAEATLLAKYRPGRVVNLEVDVIAKYVEAILSHRQASDPRPAGVMWTEEEIE